MSAIGRRVGPFKAASAVKKRMLSYTETLFLSMRAVGRKADADTRMMRILL